jgi:transcriptional regulator with XRE-family HTH domain
MRLKRGLTQAELARRVIARGHYFERVSLLRLERQDFNAKVTTVRVLAEALEVDPAWLACFRDGDPEAP